MDATHRFSTFGQDRVAAIKKAIADGNFPILPATIADQMIALKLDWNGK